VNFFAAATRIQLSWLNVPFDQSDVLKEHQAIGWASFDNLSGSAFVFTGSYHDIVTGFDLQAIH
jgi:hypothetical protein